MARKILKLDTSSMEEEFFSDVALVGIASGKPVYALCNMLNRHFDLKFSRKPTKDIQMNYKGETFSFPIYQHSVPLSEFRYTLYKLKLGDAMLIPGLRNLDYVWMIHSMDSQQDAMTYLAHLRNMPEIQFAGILDATKIKGKEYLIM